MSDEMMNHGHAGQEAEYEHEDLGTRGIFVFLVGLVVSGIVIYFIIVGMYSFLDKYERSQMATASPLVPLQGEMSRVTTKDEVDAMFKDNGAPMLEINERGQFRDFLMSQEEQLNSYGWVDERSGVAHIPIEHAMDLLVEQKLPVYQQGSTDVKSTDDAKTPTQKSSGKGKSSAQ
jgi:hypothetical protein